MQAHARFLSAVCIAVAALSFVPCTRTSAALAVPGRPEPRPIHENFTCYREGFVFRPTNWDEAIVEEQPARLWLEATFVSHQPSEMPLTVITHTTVNRWKQLRAQCRSYKGPLMAAVYMFLRQDNGTWLTAENQLLVNQAVARLHKFHQAMEAGENCKLTMMFMWEVYEPDAYLLYPYNTLRNFILLQAKTPLIAMIDVDLLISKGLSEEMLQSSAVQNMLQAARTRHLFILPAFEPATDGPSNLSGEIALATSVIAQGKPNLKAMAEAKKIRGFHMVKFDLGHRATNFPRWFQSTEPYEVTYEWQYEPWFIIDRLLNPFYDIRFRGYFYDKVLHAAHLHVYGYRFMTHPNQFIVHRNHPLSEVYADRQTWLRLLNILHEKAKSALHEMNQRKYEPRIEEVTRRCRARLPWWQNVLPIA